MKFFQSKRQSAEEPENGPRDPSLEDEEKANANETEQEEEGEDETQYPPFKVVLPTMIAIYLAIFLVSLDRTILGVAIPAISNEFNSFGDISWYESAYLLTLCAFQLPLGRIYTLFPSKWVFLSIVTIFEIGSIVCASAQSSVAFIVGRAISGVGGAGTISGATVLMVDLVPLRKRAKYQGFLGAVFGASSIIGPLVGGAFTSGVSWRWCFWVNVPIGVTSLIALVFILPATPPPGAIEGTFLRKLAKLDPIGTALIVPALICIVLALQYGGSTFGWNDGRVIALLVVGGVLLLAFSASQIWLKDDGTVPPRIICQRSVAAATILSLVTGACLVITSFYLPIWFQAIKGISAIDAGVRLLAYFLGSVVAVIGSGILISKLGYFNPFLIAGTAISVVGTALLTTLRVDSGPGEWVSYEIVVGLGFGMALQQPFNVVNTVLSRKDIPIGVSVISFANFLGGSIFVSVCQAILASSLQSGLAERIPGFDASSISTAGATNIRKLVPQDDLSIVLSVYNAAINNLFYCALGLASLSFVVSFLVEWKSMKARK